MNIEETKNKIYEIVGEIEKDSNQFQGEGERWENIDALILELPQVRKAEKEAVEGLVKISILKDGDSYAYMEYQNGNNPEVFNDTYGCGEFYDLEEVLKSIFDIYRDVPIILTDKTYLSSIGGKK